MIKRQLAIFLIVGALTVGVDFCVYRGLNHLVDVALAKAIGFIAGTVFAYVANRLWTFGQHPHRRGSVWRFCVLYASTLGINVWVNHLALMGFNPLPLAVPYAFVVATGLSAMLNFLGMKFFVFTTAPRIEPL